MAKIKKNKIIILSFIDWFRPGFKAGGTVTSFGNFVDFMKEYFEFKIITRNNDFLEKSPYKLTIPDTWIKKENNLTYYISSNKLNFFLIKKIIRNQKFDFLYVNGLFSLYFSILPVLFSKGYKCIVNPHGMLSVQAFSSKPYKKFLFFKIVNFFDFYKDVTFHVSNLCEANDIKKNIKKYREIKIANQFPRKIKTQQKNKIAKKQYRKFINIARISPEKGTLKMINALSKVSSPLTLDIYGAIYDTEYWKKCKEKINELPPNIKLNYQGFVDGSILMNLLVDYDYMILLSEGENFGHSILECFSSGTPVIISNMTPWKNLKKNLMGWNVDTNDSKEVEFAINEAVNIDAEKYLKMSKATLNFSEKFSTNSGLIEKNKSLFLNN